MRNLLLAIAVIAPLAACDRGDGPSDRTAASGAQETPAPGTGAAPPSNPGSAGMADAGAAPAGNLPAQDAEALGLLSAINQHEIKAAQQAKQHDLPADVSAFADMMVRDHTDNDAKIHALGQPADTPAVQAQKTKGEAELKALGARRDGYAKAYVDAMVKGHAEALATLDDKLIPAAASESVKSHLAATREVVAMHLEQAKSLQ